MNKCITVDNNVQLYYNVSVKTREQKNNYSGEMTK
jgi:hypothetical protein